MAYIAMALFFIKRGVDTWKKEKKTYFEVVSLI
jgi:hypothetical protein